MLTVQTTQPPHMHAHSRSQTQHRGAHFRIASEDVNSFRRTTPALSLLPWHGVEGDDGAETSDSQTSGSLSR